jgi:hypothetical protein
MTRGRDASTEMGGDEAMDGEEARDATGRSRGSGEKEATEKRLGNLSSFVKFRVIGVDNVNLL